MSLQPTDGSACTLVLGIETSCDETAAAVVVRDGPTRGRLLSSVVRSQWEQHRQFEGVVPEIAARAHVECLDDIVAEALSAAGIGFGDIDGIAVTAGPGLIGGLMVGLTTGKALALATRKPLIAVNHLEAHALTVGLTEGLAPPYLLLLVSGGHTQLLLVHDVGRYERLGTTIDDALGEAFDKVAKLLDLGHPGGPEVEKAARRGNPARFRFPRPLLGEDRLDFSFSGLKTAVRLAAQQIAPLSDADVADISAGFQAAVTDIIVARSRAALDRLPPDRRCLVVAGGVAANQAIGDGLRRVANEAGAKLVIPPPALCTDNGAMVAWAGAERLALGLVDALDVAARARWPLDPGTAHAA